MKQNTIKEGHPDLLGIRTAPDLSPSGGAALRQARSKMPMPRQHRLRFETAANIGGVAQLNHQALKVRVPKQVL